MSAACLLLLILCRLGALPDKPLLLGTTTDEGSLFLPGLMPPVETPRAYSRLVKRRFGPDADKALALVPGRGEDLWTDLSRLITARWFTAFSVFFAQAMADAGRPVWLYRFAAPAPAGALDMLMDESGASGVTAVGPLPVEPLVPLVAASWRTTTYRGGTPALVGCDEPPPTRGKGMTWS